MSQTADIATAIFGGGGALACLGAGVKFIWDKVDTRLKAIEAELRECRKRETAAKVRAATQLTVIELLWMALKAVDPSSEALKRGKKLLDDLKQEERS